MNLSCYCKTKSPVPVSTENFFCYHLLGSRSTYRNVRRIRTNNPHNLQFHHPHYKMGGLYAGHYGISNKMYLLRDVNYRSIHKTLRVASHLELQTFVSFFQMLWCMLILILNEVVCKRVGVGDILVFFAITKLLKCCCWVKTK